MEDLKKLKLSASGISVLYVEDNDTLRANAQKLLNKFFDSVDTAVDGQDGLEQFEKHRHQLLITDIKMPNMDGITLTEHAKVIQPDTKIIIMSAFDDKEYLHKAIELGVFRFLKKPVNLSLLTDILYEAVTQINNEKDSKLSCTYMDNSFNSQSSMVIMFNESKAIFVNRMFLEFFKVNDIDEFEEKYSDLGMNFLEHENFLYNQLDKTWFDELIENEKKHFHVKIKNADNEIRHLILKFQKILDKDGYGILSMEDVTELNPLTPIDNKLVECEIGEHIEDSLSMFKMLNQLQEDGIKVEVHNYYKGLSITNSAVMKSVKEGEITIETTFLQEKAIQFEGKTIITSEELPHAIECNEVAVIGFEKEYVELKALQYVKTSPISRKTIRVVPEDEHTVSLFISGKEFSGDVRVEDISLDAVKLKLNSLPAGIDRVGEVTVNVVLDLDKEPLIINTKATMFRKNELEHSFSVVFKFDDLKKTLLVKYITKRQMAIIREFKGLEDG